MAGLISSDIAERRQRDMEVALLVQDACLDVIGEMLSKNKALVDALGVKGVEDFALTVMNLDLFAIMKGGQVAMSGWLDEAIKKIRGYADLKDNWNSYGAPPIDPVAIEHAVRVLTFLSGAGVREPDGIVSTVDATVGFEWYYPNDTSLGVGVALDGKLDWLDATDEDSDKWTEVEDGDVKDLAALLKSKQ